MSEMVQAVVAIMESGTVRRTTFIKDSMNFDSSFEETSNPWDANKCMEHLEGIFEVMGCSEQQKAILAAFKMEGDAKEWWRLLRSPLMNKNQVLLGLFSSGNL